MNRVQSFIVCVMGAFSTIALILLICVLFGWEFLALLF